MLCLWSDRSEFMVLFVVFNLWAGPGFIFGSVVNFQFFNSRFPVNTLGLDLL